MRTRMSGMERPLSRAVFWFVTALFTLGILCASPAVAQVGSPALTADVRVTSSFARPAATLPFAAGERLVYQVRMQRLGNVGRTVMMVGGPTEIRGTEVHLLRFDFDAKVGFVKATDRTQSWVDLSRMATLRFSKHERHPLSRHDEQVEMYPERRTWESKEGETGESPTDAPLDELSFMYFLRTIELVEGSELRFDRHFEAARNPTTVRVVRKEAVTTAAGEFSTWLLEMRVRDPRRYKGEGVIRINISDDRCRLPVRIRSSMPIVGHATMTLAEGPAGCGP
jgi:hypothetical protein